MAVGARHDRGDAETGLGAETGAEFGFAHLGNGLSINARATGRHTRGTCQGIADQDDR